MDTTENMTGGATYNKDTYIGYLKMKKGGMKVIPGEMDNIIINKRNNILSKLEKVLTGGDKLKEKNIDKYFKALGGKYIRNDMCLLGDKSICKKGKHVSLGGAKKLMELASKKYTPELLEKKFKGSAPVLYEQYIKKGGDNSRSVPDHIEMNHNKFDNNHGGYGPGYGPGHGYGHGSGYGSGYGPGHGSGYGPDYGSGYGPDYGPGYEPSYGSGYEPNRMYGGSYDNELEKLRMDIGRYQYFSGGNYDDIELNKLREEIEYIRNN